MKFDRNLLCSQPNRRVARLAALELVALPCVLCASNSRSPPRPPPGFAGAGDELGVLGGVRAELLDVATLPFRLSHRHEGRQAAADG
jgi:hypothetical protein